MFHKVYQLTLAFWSEIALAMALTIGLNVTPIFAQNWSLNGNAATNSNNFLGTTDNIGLSIRTSNVTRMTIDRYGNINLGKGIVSIGSTNFVRQTTVGANLEVISKDSYASPIVSIATPDAADFVQIIGGKANDQNSYFAWKRGALRFATSSSFLGNGSFSEKMRITDTGNVGIGSPNPQGALHILKMGIPPVSLPAEQNGLLLGIASTSGYKWIQSYGGALSLNPQGNNVGIGTTNPQSLLAVNGKITAKEVVVTLTGWSDFVFDENYQLPSLEEVERHLKEKKHLPDIPSEQEVLASGVNLGDMQAKLLQKIEELTLYVIELNKENQRLQQQFTKLEKAQ